MPKTTKKATPKSAPKKRSKPRKAVSRERLAYERLALLGCIPCSGGVAPLGPSQIRKWRKQLAQGWRVFKQHHLEKSFSFTNFTAALKFANTVGAIAEQEGHHPELLVGWGKVVVTIWTHKIDGLSESDFILAAKIEKAYN